MKKKHTTIHSSHSLSIRMTIVMLFASLTILLGAIGSGCAGYTNKSLVITQATTIAVPIFENESYWRGLEFDLTEAVANDIRSRTGLQLTNSSTADLILHGTILSYQRPIMTEGDRDIIKEGSSRTLVHIVIQRRDGSIVRERTLKETASFVIARGESEQTARAEAFEDLAESIINLLDMDW